LRASAKLRAMSGHPQRESEMRSIKKPEAKMERASEEEALKLTVAFYCIMEPERRAELLVLADKHARESARVEGVTHYLDLDRADEDRH